MHSPLDKAEIASTANLNLLASPIIATVLPKPKCGIRLSSPYFFLSPPFPMILPLSFQHLHLIFQQIL